MKLTVLQKDLAKALSYTSHFVSQRAQLPILANIKLSAHGAKLTIQATNLEMSCSSGLGAQIEEEGEVAVAARTLVELISSLKAEKITLSATGELLKIETESFKGSVSGLNTSDFPEVPASLSKGIVLPRDGFLEALASTIFSCSTEPSRPALAGVLVILNNESFSLVASDGFRLSRKVVHAKVGTELKMIVPKAVLMELLRVSSDTKKISLEARESEKQILFSLDDTVIASRVVEGEYPPFEKIIPTTSSISVGVDKSEFQSTIKTAAVFARDGANVITLHIGEDTLKVSAESARTGSQESVVAAKITGPALSIPYNYRFIEEFLGVVKGESVTMKFNGTTSAGIFLDAGDEDYLHLIMPVKS